MFVCLSQDSIALDALFLLQSLVFRFIVIVIVTAQLHLGVQLFLRETSIALDALLLLQHAAADYADWEAEDRHCNR